MTDSSKSAHASEPGDWLGARNPTVKLAVLFVVSLATLFLFEPVPLAVVYVVALFVVRGAAAIPWSTMLLAQVPFLLFAVGLIAVNALSRPGEVILESPVRITVEGLVIGFALALRGMVIGVMTIGFLASTPPRDLMISLTQHARFSPRFAYALLAGHRMLLAMPQRWGTIRAAQAVRARLRRDGRPRFGARGFGRAAFALLVTSIRSSERIALALESRGLGRGQRTLWRPVPLDGRDALLAAVVVTGFTAALGAGYALTTLWSG